MNQDGSFAGKVAFVTGAASGIGHAAALASARAPAWSTGRGPNSSWMHWPACGRCRSLPDRPAATTDQPDGQPAARQLAQPSDRCTGPTPGCFSLTLQPASTKPNATLTTHPDPNHRPTGRSRSLNPRRGGSRLRRHRGGSGATTRASWLTFRNNTSFRDPPREWPRPGSRIPAVTIDVRRKSGVSIRTDRPRIGQQPDVLAELTAGCHAQGDR
jgi:hypothetical protein